MGKNKDSFDAKLWAISDALELSIKKTRNGNPSMITIFTDSRAAIAKILDSNARTGGDAIRTLIYENAHEIKSSGHTLILRWVPSHSKILGNEKADVSAKDTARKRGRQTDHSSSLTFIKTELRKTKLAELVLWHQIKSQEREATLQGSYVPIVKEGITPVLGKALKKFAMRFYQLKIGHGAVGTFLARIGLIETPECWWCGAQEQTVIHLYTKCRKWRKERRKLSKRLGQLGISWQPRPERRWLGRLLANEQAIGPVLEFLKDTEVGSREGARERELEWQGRNDREGENLLSE